VDFTDQQDAPLDHSFLMPAALQSKRFKYNNGHMSEETKSLSSTQKVEDLIRKVEKRYAENGLVIPVVEEFGMEERPRFLPKRHIRLDDTSPIDKEKVLFQYEFPDHA
jgi:hypothetical protein